MNAKLVQRLSSQSSGCGDVSIEFDGLALNALYEYNDSGVMLRAVCRFEQAAAFRFRDEMRSSGFAEGSYDNVVEIVNSSWLADLSAGEPKQIYNSVSEKRHFAVFFSNNGYLEVIANSFSHTVVT